MDLRGKIKGKEMKDKEKIEKIKDIISSVMLIKRDINPRNYSFGEFYYSEVIREIIEVLKKEQK